MKKSGQLVNKKGKGTFGGKKVKFPSQSKASTSSRGKLVVAPVAMSRRVKTAAPKISTLSNGDMRVHHREYLVDILGSVDFSVTSLPINPGQVRTFPWLSALAARYESYRFNSLSFYLERTAPTSATGTVLLAVDYDAADSAPSSKMQALSYRSSVRGAPWDDLAFVCLPEDLHKLPMNNVRTTVGLIANTDVKTYDIGNLYVVTQGQAGTSSVSELYVEYDVSLLTPQMEPATGCFKVFGSAGLSATVAFGTNAAIDAQSSVPISVNVAGDILTFLSPFTGMVEYDAIGTVLGPIATVGSTCTINYTRLTAGTNITGFVTVYYVTALAGQTLQLQVTNTTFTSATVHGASFDVANVY